MSFFRTGNYNLNSQNLTEEESNMLWISTTA